MEKIRAYIEKGLENPMMMALVGAILGIILGLTYGWVINPTEFYNTEVAQLREDLKVDYLRMAIDSYALNKDAEKAEARFERLGEDPSQYLEIIELNPGNQLISDIDAFRDVVTLTSMGEDLEGEPAGQPVEEGKSGGNFLRWALLITVILAGALVARYFLTQREPAAAKPKSAASIAQDITSQMETTDYEQEGEGPPMHQFVTTYVLGDNLFDDSFSIESAAGEFLGECGVGISEAIGVGEPKRVTAFEVWLFDQNDIKTVTKVLMSGHAYYDDAVRSELEKKGEPILAQPGSEFVLETNNLRIIGRVMDMGYGEGPLPEESFFDRLSIELSVWPNDGVDEMPEMDFDEI